MPHIKNRPIKLSTNSSIVHAGNPTSAPDYLSTTMPIYASVTFRYDDINRLRNIVKVEEFGFDYSREANPTRHALEKALMELESGSFAWACGTGMSAVFLSLIISDIKPDDHILIANETYSGNRRLFKTLPEKFRFVTKLFSITKLDLLEEMLKKEKTHYKALFCETISNPTSAVLDIENIVRICQKNGIALIVDNTLATPLLCKPLQWGADIVVHSLSKALSGHGDVMGGIVITHEKYSKQLRDYAVQMGLALSPHDAWLIHRGLKTLHLRFDRQCRNAKLIANFLKGCTLVNNVTYLGLESHPQNSLAKKLFKKNLFGSILTFDLMTHDISNVTKFLQSLRLILTTGSVGDIYSQAFDQFSLSLSELTKNELYQLGLSENTIRLSVGIEDHRDLIADINQALYSTEHKTG